MFVLNLVMLLLHDSRARQLFAVNRIYFVVNIFMSARIARVVSDADGKPRLTRRVKNNRRALYEIEHLPCGLVQV